MKSSAKPAVRASAESVRFGAAMGWGREWKPAHFARLRVFSDFADRAPLSLVERARRLAQHSSIGDRESSQTAPTEEN